MKFENIISFLALLGIGGLIGTYFRILWERQNKAHLQKLEFKEARYKCAVILMLSCLDFEKNKPMLHLHGRQYINSLDDLKDELKLEWNNMLLFASNEVLSTMREFIKEPSQRNYQDTAIAMRKDLWGGKVTTADIEKLNL